MLLLPLFIVFLVWTTLAAVFYPLQHFNCLTIDDTNLRFTCLFYQQLLAFRNFRRLIILTLRKMRCRVSFNPAAFPPLGIVQIFKQVSQKLVSFDAAHKLSTLSPHLRLTFLLIGIASTQLPAGCQVVPLQLGFCAVHLGQPNGESLGAGGQGGKPAILVNFEQLLGS